MNVTDLIDQLTTIEQIHGRIDVVDESGRAIDDAKVEPATVDPDGNVPAEPVVVLVTR